MMFGSMATKLQAAGVQTGKLSALLFALFLCIAVSPGCVAAGVTQPVGGPAAGAYNALGGAAISTATYVTLTLDTSLDNQRILTAGTGINIVDSGAKNPVTISLNNSLAVGATGGTSAQTALNSIAGVSVSGDIIYYNGTNWVHLPIGTPGQLLNVSGGSLPAWSTVSAGAPTTATYLTLSNDAGLSAERVLTAGTGITITDAGANSTATVAIDTNVVTLTGAQLLTNKTLTTPSFSWNAGAGVVLKGTSFDANLKWADFAAARNITIPDPGTTASVVLTEAAATINGVKTFGSAPKLSTNTITTSSGNTITLPDATDTMVNLGGTQTLVGKTLTTPIITSAGTLTFNQVSGNYVISAVSNNPTSSRTYSWYDAGGAGDIAIKTGTPTQGGVAYGDGNKILFSAAGTSGQAIISGGTGSPTIGVLGNSGGGTAQSSYTAGDILVANDSGALVKLAGGADGNVLAYDSTGNPNVKWSAAGSGSGTVNSGTANQMTYYAGTGTVVSGNANATISSGALTLGVLNTTAGSLVLNGGTSGTVTVNVPAAAGTTTFTLPSSNGTASQTLITNGSGVTSWADNEITVTGTLSSAQIKALRATPVAIVAAPGAGKMIVPVSTTAKFIYGGTAYTGAGDSVNVYWGTTTSLNASGIANATMVGTTTTWQLLNIGNTATTTTPENVALNWFNPGASEFITGNSTISWSITYRIVTP